MGKVFLVLALLLSSNVWSQTNIKIERFSALQKEGEVFLEWTMSPGSVCIGIDIERSEDTGIFRPIGSISGVCGNLTKSISYSFTDEFPLQNIPLRYRLSFGTLGYSSIASITVADVGKDEYRIYPNPSGSLFNLNFYNPRQEKHTLKIINSDGLEVHKEIITGDAHQLDLTNMADGVYHFFIHDDSFSNTVSGRFVVSH